MLPIPIPVSRPVYPIVFYFFLFTFPFLFLLDEKKPSSEELVAAVVASVLLVASFVFIQWRCSSWAVSYWGALGARCVALESGCINITLVYIIPLLMVYHMRFFITALLSIFLGRAYAQVATLNFIKSLLVEGYPYEEVKSLLLTGEKPRLDM